MTRIFGKVGVCLVLLLPGAAVIAAGDALFPPVPPGKGENCVEPTDVMRRDHMNFLLHQRDETVHRGIRETKYSLVGCIGCHVQRDAQGDPIPVNAGGQFCESCHEFTGVRIDCFECHASVPAGSRISAALPEGMLPPPVSVGKAAGPEIK